MSLSHLKPRPPVVIRESDADTLYALAINAMLQAPRLAAMMLEELGRSTVEPDEGVPATVAGLGSVVRFVDGFTGATSTVTLVHPADADGPSGRVSVLTPDRRGTARAGAGAIDPMAGPIEPRTAAAVGRGRRLRLKPAPTGRGLQTCSDGSVTSRIDRVRTRPSAAFQVNSRPAVRPSSAAPTGVRTEMRFASMSADSGRTN